MYYISDAHLDEILSQDIPYGDLTVELLGIEKRFGTITCWPKADTVICGASLAARLFRKVGLTVDLLVEDGAFVAAGTAFLQARGSAGGIHAVYKTAQNIMEYCSGIATRTAQLVAAVQSAKADCRVVTTRKHFPGTKMLALYAVQVGGGSIHRVGLSESVLIFDQHRAFCPDFLQNLSRLKALDPERKIAVEAGDFNEAVLFARAGADIVQCEKFTPAVFADTVRAVKSECPRVLVSAAGGIRADNAAHYAAAGADFVVTTWPYFGKPADVKMHIEALPTD